MRWFLVEPVATLVDRGEVVEVSLAEHSIVLIVQSVVQHVAAGPITEMHFEMTYPRILA